MELPTWRTYSSAKDVDIKEYEYFVADDVMSSEVQCVSRPRGDVSLKPPEFC